MSQLPRRIQLARAHRICAEERLRAAEIEAQLNRKPKAEKRQRLLAVLQTLDQRMAAARDQLRKLQDEA